MPFLSQVTKLELFGRVSDGNFLMPKAKTSKGCEENSEAKMVVLTTVSIKVSVQQAHSHRVRSKQMRCFQAAKTGL